MKKEQVMNATKKIQKMAVAIGIILAAITLIALSSITTTTETAVFVVCGELVGIVAGILCATAVFIEKMEITD